MGLNDRLYQRKAGGVWHGWFYDKEMNRIRISTHCASKRAAAVALRREELLA